MRLDCPPRLPDDDPYNLLDLQTAVYTVYFFTFNNFSKGIPGCQCAQLDSTESL